MATKTTNRKLNEGWIKIILIIITLFAIGLNVHRYITSEQRREQDAITIRNQLDVITQSSFIISQHERRINDLEREKDNAISYAQQYRDSLDNTKQIIAEVSQDIKKLEEKIKEFEEIQMVEGDVEEQYDFFIEWSDEYVVELDLTLVNEIIEYNEEFILVPTLNIIGANLGYYNKLNLVTNYIELTETQRTQINNYQEALDFSEEEAHYYRSAFVRSELINIELRGIIRQERRRSLALGGVVAILGTYIILK